MRRSALCVFNALAAPGPSTTDAGADPPIFRLAQVSVRWARAACRNHLKQEGTYERVVVRTAADPGTEGKTATGRGKRTGMGAQDKDVSKRRRDTVVVEAWERGLRAVGGAFERRYRFALRDE